MYAHLLRMCLLIVLVILCCFGFMLFWFPSGRAQEGVHPATSGGDRRGGGQAARQNVRFQLQDQGQRDQGAVDHVDGALCGRQKRHLKKKEIETKCSFLIHSLDTYHMLVSFPPRPTRSGCSQFCCGVGIAMLMSNPSVLPFSEKVADTPLRPCPRFASFFGVQKLEADMLHWHARGLRCGGVG